MPKTALVTGASRGIGRELARELAHDGYRVLLAMRNARNESDALLLPRAVVEVLDVASSESISALAQRLTQRREVLDALVNNAGINQGPASEIWNVNVRGPLLLTRALEPLLADGARIAMVSSGMGRKGAQSPELNERLAAIGTFAEIENLCDEAPGGYGASKAALNRLAELFSEELAPRHILVNAVSPGWVRSDMGGPSAPRSLAKGAASVLWAIRLGRDGPTGGFFEDGRRMRV
jgi:NAD(P)-dependent dehydrogenase (short-subunit alcohol dehydrogenase family)